MLIRRHKLLLRGMGSVLEIWPCRKALYPGQHVVGPKPCAPALYGDLAKVQQDLWTAYYKVVSRVPHE